MVGFKVIVFDSNGGFQRAILLATPRLMVSLDSKAIANTYH